MAETFIQQRPRSTGWAPTPEVLPYQLVVTRPAANERWQVGELHTIVWQGDGQGNVTIEVSRDGGNTWSSRPLITTENDGQWDWSVSEPASELCLVRVTDHNLQVATSRSFAIYPVTLPEVGPRAATIDFLLTRINSRLRDFYDVATVTLEAGDTNYPLDRGIDADSMVFEYAPTESGAQLALPSTFSYEIDVDSGWLTLAEEEDYDLRVTYKFKTWTDQDILYAINDALDSLFPYFWVPKKDTSLSFAADTWVYEVPPGFEQVNEVSLDIGGRWVEIDQWKWNEVGEVEFTGTIPLAASTIRLQGIARFKTKFNLDEPLNTAQTFTGMTGLPETAIEPVVYYVMWSLVNSSVIRRARFEGATATQTGATTVTDMRAVAADLWQTFLQMRSLNGMQPWVGGWQLSM